MNRTAFLRIASGAAPRNYDERAEYLARAAESLGLNPVLRPIQFLDFRSGRSPTLYLARGATDALARREGVVREIVDGPKVITVDGTRLAYAKCRATSPDGRVETATATAPLVDPVNVLMTVETKAKRRATIALLGLGLSDESEIETIPGAVPPSPRKAEFYAALSECGGAREAARIWVEFRDEFRSSPSREKRAAWNAVLDASGEKSSETSDLIRTLVRAIENERDEEEAIERAVEEGAERAALVSTYGYEDFDLADET